MSDTIVKLRGRQTVGDDLRELARRADAGELTGYAIAATLKDGISERHIYSSGDYVFLAGAVAVLQTEMSLRVIETQTRVSINGDPVPR